VYGTTAVLFAPSRSTAVLLATQVVRVWDHSSAIHSFKVHGSAISPINLVRQPKTVVDLHIVDYKGASAYKPLCHIFPNSAITKKWYERRLDAMLTAVGEDLTLYSVHSLRAGGVTELFLSGVIPVQIFGRWKFESALIYFMHLESWPMRRLRLSRLKCSLVYVAMTTDPTRCSARVS